MKSHEIRKKFLEFFKSKKHEIVESDSLVPKADPTLLFTSAGMNQFKEQFLGHNITYSRAASSQRCLRTADLENVGKTPHHHTFFEMLGNFSFGDYFKKEAIEWGWEFMTKVLNLKEKNLWVSVYKDDEESYKIWQDVIKVKKEKIVKLGAKDNFWPSNAPENGPNGPCGPCSEIFYDWGKDVGCRKKTCNPDCDCGRFVEVWNLVFTQFERKGKGKLDPLPSKNIDTGMGLERITAVIEGVKTNFETDLFKPVIKEISRLNPKLKEHSLNTIADHVRAVTFAICDGIAPSNEERGYVIRKLIRRAYLRGGLGKSYLYNLVPRVIEVMKDTYPVLREKQEEISLIVKEEEERFKNTLSVAMPILKDDIKSAKGKPLKGDKIFKLVDTYGLPLEVIEERAKEKKVKLDIKSFESLMEERRVLSRKKSKMEGDIFSLNLFTKAPKVSFSDDMPLKGKIAYMVKEKSLVKKAKEGDTIEIMTDPQGKTFYTESGGQVGDRGRIKSEKGEGKILNTVKIDERVVHVAKVERGSLSLGDTVTIDLDSERKKRIAKNHTATHLLHSALREVLGDHVHQAGSLVAEDRLRFDFTYIKKVSEREFEKIESLVNECIEKGIELEKEEKTLEEAKKEGAMALFGEKYSSKVRVIKMSDFSKEVCGGTHVNNTKEIELFKIVRESSVASGIRRIEAVTGHAAKEWIKEKKAREEEKLTAERKKEEDKRLEKEKLKKSEAEIDDLIKRAKTIKNSKLIIESIKDANMAVIRKLADTIKTKEKSFFALLAGQDKDKLSLVLSISKDIVKKGADASRIIKDLAKEIEGSGGGRRDFAQAGGKNLEKLKSVFEKAEKTALHIIEGVSK